jgi:hypothetical protein
MNQCLLHLSSESEKMLLVALGKGFMRIKLNFPAKRSSVDFCSAQQILVLENTLLYLPFIRKVSHVGRQ